MTTQDIEFLREVLYSEISSLFDPEVRFIPEHKGDVRMARNALQKPLGRIHKLSKPILRNAFLHGCLEFTRSEPIEHHIVGFGRRRGGGTEESRTLANLRDTLLPKLISGELRVKTRRSSSGGLLDVDHRICFPVIATQGKW